MKFTWKGTLINNIDSLLVIKLFIYFISGFYFSASLVFHSIDNFFFMQEEQLDLVSLGSSVEEEDSPLVFLEKVHLFGERVEEFISTPLPSMINFSITPRAAAYLQQHWPAVTIGSLEEAPVPKLCCSSRCCVVGADVKAETWRDQPDSWVQDLWCELRPTTSVVLLGLLLLLVALWINPVGGASLGFSLVSRFSQIVHGLSSELMTSAWDVAGSVYTVVEGAVERWSSYLSSISVKASQQLVALF